MNKTLFVALQLAACSDKTPARVDLAPLGTILSTTDALPLHASVFNKKGEPLAEADVAYAVAPADVAIIGQDRSVRCIKSGSAQITATAGAAASSQPLSCRPVARIEAPASLRLIIPNAPEALAATFFDPGGTLLQGVEPDVTVDKAAVVSWSNGRLRPLSVGTAVVSVRAGTQGKDVPVTVVRRVESKPLLLNDGGRYNVTLYQGNYEVEVKVRSGNTGYGVTLAWVGGEGCKDEPEAQSIVSRCRIDNTGSVIISNPTMLGMGPAADGFLSVYEVP